MGLLACSRKVCDNILCVRYSSEYGHICEECFEELVKLGKNTNIYNFLRSEKRSYSELDESITYFDEIFQLRN